AASYCFVGQCVKTALPKLQGRNIRPVHTCPRTQCRHHEWTKRTFAIRSNVSFSYPGSVTPAVSSLSLLRLRLSHLRMLPYGEGGVSDRPAEPEKENT